MRFNSVKAAAASVAVVAGAAIAVLPGTAGAALIGSPGCTGDNVTGIGASLQRTAQSQWGAEIVAPDPLAAIRSGFGYDGTFGCAAWRLPADGGTKGPITYSPAGSGAGRSAFGANGALRPVSPATTYNYGGVDEAPTTAQLDIANKNSLTPASDRVTSDDAQLNTIPAAATAVAVAVKLPVNCTLSLANRQATLQRIESAFAQDVSVDTWVELFPGIAGASCVRTTAINRVVRFDSSGTTFAFKGYLNQAGRNPWLTYANIDWPTRSPNWFTSNRVGGAGAQADALNGTTLARDNSGTTSTLGDGIAYLDLATARARGFGSTGATDRTFWIRVERPATPGVFVSPSAFASTDGDTQTGTKGANCAGVSYANVPADTTLSWAAVDPVPTRTAYPICPLTYALAWTDPKPFNSGYTSGASTTTPFTQNQAQTTKDYLNYILKGGQDTELTDNDYSALPSSIKTIAQTGVDSLIY